jgi:hypothetical protein
MGSNTFTIGELIGGPAIHMPLLKEGKEVPNATFKVSLALGNGAPATPFPVAAVAKPKSATATATATATAPTHATGGVTKKIFIEAR